MVTTVHLDEATSPHATSPTANGTPVNLTAGDGGDTSGNGGVASLTGGNALGDGFGGNVVLTAGDGASGDGGNVIINTGVGSGTPGHILVNELPEFSDDVTAAEGGVPVTGLYRNGSSVRIRYDTPTAPDPITEAPQDGKFYLRQDGGWIEFPSVHASQISVPDPRNTTNTSWTMMGLEVAFTPVIASRIVVTCDGQISNSASNGETDAQLMYGLGVPPANGVPIPADAVMLGAPIRFKSTTSAGGGQFVPFSQSALITDLTFDQPIWIGLALKVVNGTGSVQDISLLAYGLM